ncbi:MAG: ferrous iron transporter B [Phycisphaeraceae bacterium]|nr:ferrous iron transporter B [Phycisphaeraceae bacterium]
MPTASHDVRSADPRPGAGPSRFALIGNPNTGKSTLFNRLCGLRVRTANFPGSTVEAHEGSLEAAGHRLTLIDLPGTYGLHLDRPETQACRQFLFGEMPRMSAPDGVLVIVDATNLARNLVLVAEVAASGRPMVVAINMIDRAEKTGLRVSVAEIESRLGCPVMAVSARTGAGCDALRASLMHAAPARPEIAALTESASRIAWATATAEAGVDVPRVNPSDATLTDRIDAVATHPIGGVIVFLAIMTALFWAIFSLATVPMDLIELFFAGTGGVIEAVLPEGAVRELLADGVVAGISGVLVFLPQICLLFFLISLLEDTGYLARAACVTDRLLRRFGLPGHAFIPFLSAHACAIPAVMSARLIPDARDRLAAVLVAPFFSCSARLPVYVLLIGLLFADRPFLAGVAFTACYALGAVAALLTSLLIRRTAVRGEPAPMVIEFPEYRLPSLRTALVTTWDRALIFLRKAGTVILAICIVLWWLGNYPRSAPPEEATLLAGQAALVEASDPEEAAAFRSDADRIEARERSRGSIMGRLGRAVEPVLAPIGCDWRLSVGLLSSFLAREVFVGSLTIVLAGEEEEDTSRVREVILGARRDDGSALLTPRSAASLLVYYVLAMQCLPTLAVVRRETGSWKWPLMQLGWMSGVAWILAAIVHAVLPLAGIT